MGKANVVTYQYMKENAKFADLCNFYLYDGNTVIKAEDLEEKDVTELALPKGLGGTIAVEKVRDILKNCCIKTAGGVTYLVIGIENQTDIHYAMTVRNMLYDALNYTSQVNSCAKRHRKDKDVVGSEFLSGFTKDDKLLRFVPDYRLNLIVPDEIEDFDKFQTELGPVLEFISCADSGKEMKQALLTRRKQWENLSEEAVELLNACVDAKIKINDNAEKGAGRNVCKGIEELMEMTKAEGKAEGALVVLQQLVLDGLLDISIAAERAQMSKDEFQRLLQGEVE